MELRLDDGLGFSGRAFGAPRQVSGEVVFNTGMTGYVETLTDPSYRGQILVLTYPLQGNYGVPEPPFESAHIQIEGLVVSHYASGPHHHGAVQSLSKWLTDQGVPAIEGVDTRALTRHLREFGTIQGQLLEEGGDGAIFGVNMNQVARMVTCKAPEMVGEGDLTVMVIDTGVKESIIRSLVSRGVRVLRVPFHHPWEEHLPQVHGVVLSNGPGDPASLDRLVQRLKILLERPDLPVFGICLGHQLLARAAGAKTYKMKYGHRSFNQPVQDMNTGRAYITSQNHGYAVDLETLSDAWRPWFINLHDRTNEGIEHKHLPLSSVQFHPEASAGPRDTAYLFDDFLRQVARCAGFEADTLKLSA